MSFVFISMMYKRNIIIQLQVDHTFQFYKNCNKIKSAKSTNFITDEIINDFTINHRTKTGPTEVESKYNSFSIVIQCIIITKRVC